MARRKNVSTLSETKFRTVSEFEHNGFMIYAGDTIKVKGEYGGKFKVVGLTTNIETGAQWIDCFEIIGGVPSVFRSFKQDKIKRVPQRKKRAKRVQQ